jgi:hypothetical protein
VSLLVSSKRPPWPYDARIGSASGVGGVGLMLKPDDNGIMVAQRAKTLDAVVPSDYEYGSQSPFQERTYALEDTFMGMGQRVQEKGAPRRYFYGIDIDTSLNGKWMKGPEFTSQTVTQKSNSQIVGMTRAKYNNTEVIFVAAGQYLFYRETDGTGFDSGTATAGGGSTLTNSAETWTVNQWAGYRVNIFSGTGSGQSRTVASNTSTVLTVSSAWSVTPDATSVYEISPYGLVKDFGSTQTIVQMARFWDADPVSPMDALYIARAAGNLAYLNGTGTTVTIMAGGDGPPEAEARTIEVLGNELWVGWDNKISKVEASPITRSNWSGAIYIGDATTTITWLRQNHNELFIFKTDGIYTISVEGEDQELFPGLRINRSDHNGVNATAWLDSIWAPYGESLYKIEMDGTLSPSGSEQLLENGSEVRGHHIGFAGHNTWFGYVVLYNSENLNSYLMKYGSWVEDDSDPMSGASKARDVLKFRQTWHGALKKWSAKQATSVQTMFMPFANDRLYVGFLNGTIEFALLPRNSPNPVNDSNCRFTTSDSSLYWPIHHAGFQADHKIFRGFSVFGQTMSNSKYAEIWYRVDPNASFVALKRASTDADPATFTQNAQRIDIPEDTPVTGKQIEVLVKLKNTVNSITPILDGVAIHEQIRPAFILEYTFTVLARNFITRRDGTVDRRRAETIRSQLQDAVSAIGTVEMQLPFESTQRISVIDYQEILLADTKRWGIEWDITIKGIQFRTLSSTATDDGDSTYGALEQYTYGTLEQYTYGQLETRL